MNRIIVVVMLLIVMTSCTSSWVSCSKKISLGMTKEEVREKCGNPNDFGQIVSTNGVMERWSYYYWDAWTGYNKNIGQCNVYFLDGEVSSYQE